MRERRINNEWLLLEELRAVNTERLLALARDSDSFSLTLRETPALRERPQAPEDWKASVRTTHSVRISFPRFYPAMPCEVYVDDSVFHPNAHPDTGFICLWERHLALHTVAHALVQMQAVLSGRLFNRDERQVMQPKALDFYLQPEAAARLPLPCSPLLTPARVHIAPDRSPLRRRLS
jgi:ubiquitin-protein ligase